MWTAIIAGTASLVVALLTYLLSGLQTKQQSAQKTTQQYLSPLRYYVAENVVRLSWISADVRQQGTCSALLCVSRAAEVSSKSREWFNAEGVYLATSCYLTARLFSCLGDVRRELPYFKLRRGHDTELLKRIRKVNIAFSQDFGIFYVTQDSIGDDVRDGQRKVSYREFCELLIAPDRRVWFDRLIAFYLDLGAGGHKPRFMAVWDSLRELSRFLDDAVGAGESLKAVEESEWREPPFLPPANG